MASEQHSTKRQALKLAQLASYDDFLTDALVDRVSLVQSIHMFTQFAY